MKVIFYILSLIILFSCSTKHGTSKVRHSNVKQNKVIVKAKINCNNNIDTLFIEDKQLKISLTPNICEFFKKELNDNKKIVFEMNIKKTQSNIYFHDYIIRMYNQKLDTLYDYKQGGFNMGIREKKIADTLSLHYNIKNTKILVEDYNRRDTHIELFLFLNNGHW